MKRDRAARGADAPRALAILARYPLPGAVKTRLAASIGDEEAAALYKAFLQDLACRFAADAREDGYSLIWAQTPGQGDLRDVVGRGARVMEQRGEDLAERLHTLAADLASTGYERIVMIGSDMPQLPCARVRAAFDMLLWRDVTLGPAEDGGYYLVGLRAASEPPDIFRGISMSTPQVLAHTLRRIARQRLTAALLPTDFDVDTLEDACRLRHTLADPGAHKAPSPRMFAALRWYLHGACDLSDDTSDTTGLRI